MLISQVAQVALQRVSLGKPAVVRAEIWRDLCKSRGSAPIGVWNVPPVWLSLADAQVKLS